MDFDQSGLPPIQLIEEAFGYSQRFVSNRYAEEMRNFERQIGRAHRQNVQMLMQEKRQGKITDEDYNAEMKDLEKLRDQQLKAGPDLIRRELEKGFAKAHLLPAQLLFRHAGESNPESIAAVLLVECVRSPRDFAAVETTFGPVVAGYISDLLHIELYPVERAQNLKAAAADVRRVYCAQTLTQLESIIEQAETLAKRSPGQRLIFPEGQEQLMFENSRAIWGTDEKLQTRLVETFNKAAEKLSSPFRFAKDIDGDLSLVNAPPPKPPVTPPGKNLPVVRPKPPGGGSIGGDVF